MSVAASSVDSVDNSAEGASSGTFQRALNVEFLVEKRWRNSLKLWRERGKTTEM
jgi:hypothetical protein